ncbi:hypothetical protein [Saccharothrix violaceirubra]|uniref:Uncharacterized protein n=1 Tax=Saccharothrix violaceirubra TaxID=413306 RepID=A0A7W7T2H2_9PSEU|nr:hypothetical protein [Saccharothrix violaceirubra]
METVDESLRFTDVDDSLRGPAAGPGALWRIGHDLPGRQGIAHGLAVHYWFDVVDDLVTAEPKAFDAIVSELDRLGDHAALNPIPAD